jgi:outer membrane protein OmpA-like peptidoglycan-associated protein
MHPLGEEKIMAALMSKSVRSGMSLLAACAVLGLAGCETTGKTGQTSASETTGKTGQTSASETTGKIGQTSAFDVSKASPDNIKKALESDGRVSLSGVLFETDSARLNPAGEDLVARLAAVLTQNPGIKVAVVGHTDSTGAFQYNLDLSHHRAQSIVSSLVQQHGIDQHRLAPVGVGPLSPVASNDTPEGRAQNRRVDVVLIK